MKPLMKALHEMTDAELMELLPTQAPPRPALKTVPKPPPVKPAPAPEPPKEEEEKPEPAPPINVTVEVKPEIIMPADDETKAADNKLIVALLKGLQSIQERMIADSEKRSEPQPAAAPDTTIIAMLKSIQAVQERLTRKKEWHFTIERTPSGDLSEIIAKEL